MGSATGRPSAGPNGYPAERRGRGLIAFASILLCMVAGQPEGGYTDAFEITGEAAGSPGGEWPR